MQRIPRIVYLIPYLVAAYRELRCDTYKINTHYSQYNIIINYFTNILYIRKINVTYQEIVILI